MMQADVRYLAEKGVMRSLLAFPPVDEFGGSPTLHSPIGTLHTVLTPKSKNTVPDCRNLQGFGLTRRSLYTIYILNGEESAGARQV